MADITSIVKTVSSIVAFKFLIDDEKQGIKTNLFIEIVVFSLGAGAVFGGTLVFPNYNANMFEIFKFWLMSLVVFFVLCISNYCIMAIIRMFR